MDELAYRVRVDALDQHRAGSELELDDVLGPPQQPDGRVQDEVERSTTRHVSTVARRGRSEPVIHSAGRVNPPLRHRINAPVSASSWRPHLWITLWTMSETPGLGLWKSGWAVWRPEVRGLGVPVCKSVRGTGYRVRHAGSGRGPTQRTTASHRLGLP
jgi:hypothetical protein